MTELADITEMVKSGRIRGVYIGKSVLPADPGTIRFHCCVTDSEHGPLLGKGTCAHSALRDALSNQNSNEMWD